MPHPDRSHNETWDSLVITGAVGIIVYLVCIPFRDLLWPEMGWIGTQPHPKWLFFGFISGRV